jgi:prephenate dehydrogenase
MTLDAEEHDRIVAYTSHLPQLASTALGSMLEGRPEAKSGIFGPALLDSTRLSLSSFQMWSDILATNRVSIQNALRNYIGKLEEFSRELEPERMRSEFDRAARCARELRDSTRGASG